MDLARPWLRKLEKGKPRCQLLQAQPLTIQSGCTNLESQGHCAATCKDRQGFAAQKAIGFEGWEGGKRLGDNALTQPEPSLGLNIQHSSTDHVAACCRFSDAKSQGVES